MYHLHWLDIIIIAIIGLSMLTGLFRGLVKEITAIFIWVAAFTIAALYSSKVALMLMPFLHDATVRKILAFVLILLAVLLLGGVCNALFSLILNRTGLSGTDRILGLGFGLVRGIFIVALLILVIQMTPLPYQQYIQFSYLYPKFMPLVDWMRQFVSDIIARSSGLTQQVIMLK